MAKKRKAKDEDRGRGAAKAATRSGKGRKKGATKSKRKPAKKKTAKRQPRARSASPRAPAQPRYLLASTQRLPAPASRPHLIVGESRAEAAFIALLAKNRPDILAAEGSPRDPLQTFESAEDLIDSFSAPDGADLDLARQKLDELKKLVEPLVDGSVDAGDLRQVREKYFARFGSQLVALLQEQNRLRLKLLPVALRLAHASPSEWKTYARLVLEAWLDESWARRQAVMFRFLDSSR